MNADPAPALKLVIAAMRLPQDGMPIAFAADEKERAALAEQLRIVAVERFEAELLAKAWQRSGVRVTGRVRAHVVQSSVVSTDEVPLRYAYDFTATFVPAGSRLARIERPDEQELHIDPDGEDPPEVFSGDTIELGSLLAESLALELDLYPRLPGERFDRVDTDPAPEEGKVSPFAKLSSLAGGEGGGRG